MKEFLQVCYEDYLTKGTGQFCVVRDDGNTSIENPDRWFDVNFQLSDFDVECLNMLNNGSVLDIACGTGVHMRYLQKANKNVYGFDISEFSVELARKFGIDNVSVASFWDFCPNELFDNVICMNGSTGIIGDISNLERFLCKCKEFLKKEGLLYVQGIDWRIDPKNKHKAYIDRNIEKGLYPGTVKFHKEYGELIEEEFDWVWVDTDLLKETSEKVGFAFVDVKHKGARYFMTFKNKK